MKHIDLSLASIIGGILNEDANLSDFSDTEKKISYAIDNRLMISLYYNDGKGNDGYNPAYGNPRGFRRIIPYCLGSRNGRLALRAFHAWKSHTKKGPFKWKFFYLDKMSNVRVYKGMHIPEIPALANPNGDKQMDRIINMIGMNKPTSQSVTDIGGQGKKTSNTNSSGAIKQLNKGGLKSLQNLRPAKSEKKLSYDFRNTQRNLDDFNRSNTPEVQRQRWSDYDKAERERQEQLKKAQVQNPPTNNQGPVNKEDMEGYEQQQYNNSGKF